MLSKQKTKWSSTIEKDWKFHKLMTRRRIQLIIQKYFRSIFASYYFYKSIFHNCFSDLLTKLDK